MKPLYTLAILSSLLVLSSCDRLSDSKKLEQTRDNPTFTMTVELVPPDQITKKCRDLGVEYEANGCAAYNLDTNHCTIYVMPQRHAHDEERLALIGHETWHCRFGRWHD